GRGAGAGAWVGKKGGAVAEAGAVDAAPRRRRAVAILAAMAGAAAIVDVEHRDAAAGPVLHAKIERTRRARGRPAVTFDQQRRPLAGGRRKNRVCRRGKKAAGGAHPPGRRNTRRGARE